MWTASSPDRSTSVDQTHRLVLELPPDPSAVPTARRAVRSLLRRSGQVELLDEAELGCSELVTNAVLHAHTPLTVTVESTADEVRVAVSDSSPDLPRQRAGGMSATTGRGLVLVAQIAAEHGVRGDPHGKTVWFTLRRPAAGGLDGADADELLAMWGDDSHDLPVARPEPGGPGTQVAGAPTRRRVRLLGLPASLWLAAEEHHRTLLRELVLLGADLADPADPALRAVSPEEDRGVDVPAADAAHRLLAAAVSSALDEAHAAGAARRPLPADHPAELPWVPDTTDLVVDVAPAAVHDFEALQDALDLAERLAADGRLLARPGLREVVAVRDWACDQVVSQSAGAPAGAWPGTDHERFAAKDRGTAAPDVVAVAAADTAVVAADDSNRIVGVSQAMADLVGWEVDDLVGRRVVALIPHDLREAHVAGFSRHLTTGQAKLLGLPLTLPVLRSDGSVVRCTVTIEQTTGADGRRVYLAGFAPLDGVPEDQRGRHDPAVE